MNLALFAGATALITYLAFDALRDPLRLWRATRADEEGHTLALIIVIALLTLLGMQATTAVLVIAAVVMPLTAGFREGGAIAYEGVLLVGVLACSYIARRRLR